MNYSVVRFFCKKLPETCSSIFLMMIMTMASMAQDTTVHAYKELPKAGIVLTFDDSGNIPHWAAQIPLFKKYGVRPTFFLNAPKSIPSEHWAMLQQLRNIGAAIGAHGTNHVRSVEMINKVGTKEFLHKEIEPVHECLKHKGFLPKSFAYPMSQRSEESDQCLLAYYGHLRSGAGLSKGHTLAETDQFFTPRTKISQRLCLIGKGCDRLDDETLHRQIYPALARAKKRDEILVLYAHNIADNGKGHAISPVMLEKIVRRAVELDLAFYSYDDLPPYRAEKQTPAANVSPAKSLLHFQPEQIVKQGSDGVTCWPHARAAYSPNGLGLMTAQKLLLTGSDVF